MGCFTVTASPPLMTAQGPAAQPDVGTRSGAGARCSATQPFPSAMAAQGEELGWLAGVAAAYEQQGYVHLPGLFDVADLLPVRRWLRIMTV